MTSFLLAVRKTRADNSISIGLTSALPLLEFNNHELLDLSVVGPGQDEINSLRPLPNAVLNCDAAIARNFVVVQHFGDGHQGFFPGSDFRPRDRMPRPRLKGGQDHVLDVL